MIDCCIFGTRSTPKLRVSIELAHGFKLLCAHIRFSRRDCTG